jgi:tetratricopeptide (TPR) repeat protein
MIDRMWSSVTGCPKRRATAAWKPGVLVALALATAVAQDRPSDFGGWFLRTYGPAGLPGTPDAALVSRAEGVFGNLLTVADRKLGRQPKLLVVDEREGLEAQALPDGTVVVNPPLLRFCFGPPTTPIAEGDARLAFVLGHEMAHLAYDDGWHAQAFAALRRFGAPELAAASDWLRESDGERQAKEARADRAGFLFLLMAGYPPQGVLRPGSSFLADWAARAESSGGPTADAAHPSLADRAGALRAQLEDVVASLPFYRFGVRLLTLGRHDDAIRLLARFRSRFPSREVGSNLGLAYYQRAQVRLADCGADSGLRYRLSTLIDPESLVSKLRLRGEVDERCAAQAGADFETARQALAEAHAQDPGHLASRLNLAVVLMALSRGYDAYGVATGVDLPPAGPTSTVNVDRAALDPRLANVAAVALHLAQRAMPFDTTGEAVTLLTELEARLAAPDRELRAAVAFNRARLLDEHGRAAAARQAWEAFLVVEPVSPWADEARRALRSMGDEPAAPAAASTPPRRTPLAERLPAAVARRLASAQREPYSLGDARVVFVTGEGVAGLEIGGVLEVVEETLEPPLSAVALGDLSRPRAVVDTGAGRRSVVLADVAYDLVGERAVTRVYFEPR